MVGNSLIRLAWLLITLLLAACTGEAAGPLPAKAASITCTAAYRADPTGPIEGEQSFTLGEQTGEQAITFADLVFHAAYYTGELDNERSLRLWVSDAGETTIYHSQLYQLQQESGPQNQFVGGHGFTGLGYSTHPTSGAELQYWCTAD
ncbi:MAG: hypothetical protein ACK2UK_21840 [Candidatus Promineifilaceae bacterium]|jgi:hypothetical protein